ncbi:hypothetical protein G6F37_004436 [Rhizopus arrhizus]|nr:hypothetical protein G6F38_000992 [Rhizopus arrhizus]KAG1159943.1 hypothetical protein G6F37_004436 [Rhizopus arrhizus]
MPGGLLQSLSTNSAQLMARATSVCTSHACQTAATSILNDLNVNIDPCSDFYQYTCVGTFTDLNNANLDSLQKLLEGNYDDLLVGVDLDPNFLSDTQKEKDRVNFNKLKMYYTACMDETAINHLGPTPIFPSIARMFTTLGYSPESFSDQRFSPQHVRVLTNALIELNMQGVENLVSIGVGVDDRHPDQYTIFINQPGLTLPSREYYSQPGIMEKYRQGLVSVISSILGDMNGDENANLRLQKMTENKLNALGSVDIEAMVDRFVEFETQLASMTLPIDQLQDPLAIYNPMSTTEFHQKYPVADWFRILRHFAPNDVSLPENIIVTAPKFMQQLTDWLLQSETRPDGASTQAIREYFTIKIILSNIGNVDRATRDLYRSTIGMLTSGATEAKPRGRECVANTSAAFGQLLGRYFVMRSFGGEPQRKQVATFIDNILSAWTERLEQNTWLDAETRTRAIEKVKKIGHQEAYSIISPDDRSPDSLSEFYSDMQVNDNDHFGNQMAVYQAYFKKEWSNIGKKVNKDEWYMNPHEVNAYYSPNFNKIVIPAGILQSPFYNTELPSYLNYGGIGAVIGHEITHAFDNSGRLYDGEGLLNSWWTAATSAAFEGKSECFIRQYNRFSIEGPDKTQYPVNGKMTLGENLADNGGVRAAYLAMQKTLDGQATLPGLEKFSPQQLFFINFGRVWCSSMRPEMSVQRVRTDVHSPASVRVNGAVQNNVEFAQAFQCPETKAMNPAEKCQIW